jgi:transposase InsO family protein
VEAGGQEGKKSKIEPVSRTAEMPGQALNVDLLFVPASHPADLKLPAVSGSSGHLVVERMNEAGQIADYPGMVFADPDLDYAEAVQSFVQTSQPVLRRQKAAVITEDGSQRAQIRRIRQAEAKLCVERCTVRKLRKQEDMVWQASWQQQRLYEKTLDQVFAQTKLRAHWGSRKLQEERHQNLREQHRQQIAVRLQEDEQWRLARESLREQMKLLPLVTTWIAVLVVTDNCTRQCRGLPLFVAGSHVTAEMVVEALRSLLPANLQFLISDRGIHFTAQAFQQFAAEANFVHVVIARHRPQSNGIAERFVRTVKEWLADKAWSSDLELLAFLRLFLLEYNDRPHQGLPVPGLSPNEFANRIWLS